MEFPKSECRYSFKDEKGFWNCNYHDSSVGHCKEESCPLRENKRVVLRELTKKEILEHYQRPKVKKIILATGSINHNRKAMINGHSGWYQYRENEKALKPLDSNFYDREIPKMIRRGDKSLYGTNNYFKPSVFNEWVSKDSDESPGSYAETTYYQLGLDIDLKEDLSVTTDENRETLEEAGQYFIDWLENHGIPQKIIKPCFSGNGLYVTIDPSIVLLDCEPHKSDKICRAFNILIKQVERKFFEENPEAEKIVQFDALNNSKRQWKTILGLHKSKPFACIPLNVEKIEIDLESAKPPLSKNVIEMAEEWTKWISKRERDYYTKKLGKLLNSPVIDREPHEELILETSKFSDVSGSKLTPLQVAELQMYERSGAIHAEEPQGKINFQVEDKEKFPPCIRKVFEDKKVLNHARAKALLSLFLKKIGMEKNEAKKLWGKLCAEAGGPTTNIFQSWFRNFNLPICKTLKSTGGGYPKLQMNDLGVCEPDDLCKNVKSPAEYLLRKTQKIDFNGARINVRIEGDGKGIGKLEIVKDGKYWKHELGHQEISAESPLGLRGRKKTIDSKRKWFKHAVGKLVNKRLSEEIFDQEIYYPIANELRDRGILEAAEDAPPVQAVELLEMIQNLKITRGIDGEENYPVQLTVKYDDKERNLELNSKSLLSLNAVQSAFLKAFLTIPEPLLEISSLAWRKHVISRLHEENKIRASKEDVSTQQYLVDRVLEEVQNSTPTIDREKVITRPRFVEWEDDLLWLPNDRIKEILEEERSRVNLKKLRKWCGKTVSQIRIKRIGDSTKRFWGFDPEKCCFDSAKIKRYLNAS